MNNATAYRRSPLELVPGRPTPRLHDRVVEVLRARHYSRRTEEAYIHWIRRFIVFHDRRHPCELAEGDVKTTMIYTHVLNRGGHGVHSPLDRLRKEPSVENQRIIRTERSA